MSYADVNGISVYYEEHGSGRPLILLPGRPGRWHGWPSCLATLTTTSSARPTW